MNYDLDQSYGVPVAASHAAVRAAFIKRTYAHLLGAVLAFVGLEAFLFSTGMAEQIIKDVFLANRMAWIALMVMFVVGGYGAQYLARSHQSVGVQYMGLALYVLLEVVFFLPLLYLSMSPMIGGNPNIPIQAGIVTLAVFGGLTAAVFVSGKDFSFMGPILWTGFAVAFGVVIASILFGFSLGLLFSGAMVALAAGFIIYSTSNVMHRYGSNEHVAASLELFAAIAMLYYYILRIFFLSRND